MGFRILMLVFALLSTSNCQTTPNENTKYENNKNENNKNENKRYDNNKNKAPKKLTCSDYSQKMHYCAIESKIVPHGKEQAPITDFSCHAIHADRSKYCNENSREYSGMKESLEETAGESSKVTLSFKRVDECPIGYQNCCAGKDFQGFEQVIFYYNQKDLAGYKEGCISLKGQWLAP